MVELWLGWGFDKIVVKIMLGCSFLPGGKVGAPHQKIIGLNSNFFHFLVQARCRVFSSSDNRKCAPISEQMLDLFRLCSDFDV